MMWRYCSRVLASAWPAALLLLLAWSPAAYSSQSSASPLLEPEPGLQDAVVTDDPDGETAADPIHPWDTNNLTDSTHKSDPESVRGRPRSVPVPEKGHLIRQDLEKPAAELPGSIEFVRNFPNPFNAETRIEFALTRAGSATLEIYNLLGQVEDRVQWSSLEAGVHAWTWQGRSSDGQALPTGVYFYRLEMEHTSVLGRMVLLK